jgi:hypothetical protein
VADEQDMTNQKRTRLGAMEMFVKQARHTWAMPLYGIAMIRVTA